MMKTIPLPFVIAAFAVAGCSSEPAKITETEKKALQGGPMPAGTWEKVAESRRRYQAEHGGASTAAIDPSKH